MAHKFERKKYLVNGRFQLRYALIMLSSVLITGLIFGSVVYATIKTVVDKRLPTVSQQLVVADVVFAEVDRILLYTVPFIGLLVIVVSIYASHKIAGPEYRLSKVLDNVAKGDFTDSTELRKHDELQALSKKLGMANKNLSVMLKQQREMLRSMIREIKALKRGGRKDDLLKLSAVAKKAEVLEKEFSKFKLQ